MLCNILLLDFQTTKICNTCAFYMHIVMKCVRAEMAPTSAYLVGPVSRWWEILL